MNVRPNAFQRQFHRALMIKVVSAVLAAILHRADTLLLRLTKGKHTFTRMAGLPVVQLTTKGARTGQWRTLPLAGLPDGGKLILIATNFGQRRHPGWYHNLKAHPECEVRINDNSRTFIARELSGDEREKYFQLALSYYQGYERYLDRAAPRKVPVMVLEPKNSKASQGMSVLN